MIIPAAGSGERMQRATPKPFIGLAGRPILEHTLLRFLQLEGLGQVIIATSAENIARSEALLGSLLGDRLSWSCIEGGSERQYSIRNALQKVDDAELVLVHDAVRPFVSSKAIGRCCDAAEKYGAAVLGMPAKDTIKKVDEKGMVTETPDRNALWQIQTPQVFKTDLLKKAYRLAAKQNYFGTDDASLVEWIGKRVQVVEGNRDNIKITYPQDLEYAKILLKNEKYND